MVLNSSTWYDFAPKVSRVAEHMDFYKGLRLYIGYRLSPKLTTHGLSGNVTFLLFFSINSFTWSSRSRTEAPRTSIYMRSDFSSHLWCFTSISSMYVRHVWFTVRKLISGQAAPEYLLDIHHASNANSEASACSVEPGSAGDVSKIVSHPTSMRRVLLAHIMTAANSRSKPNTFRSERRRTRYQPGIFLHERSTDLNDTLQRHKSQL
jgi:hypothetical protein